MKFFVAVSILSVATSAWASLIARQTFPTCSQSCLANADLGSCNADDDTCLCNTPAFISSTATCIADSCTGNDLTEANAAAQDLCLAVGVTLTASSIPISTSTSPASSGSASASTTAEAASETSSSSNGASSNGMNTIAYLAAFGLIAVNAL
ncbi:hypothetical protein EV361DRAFT_826413 [Lentinula raphanica]|uniref:CFEM domain-containing protein n=1 Tax=Lentinula raphanica TaxID=153919 RepID=A0AA38NZK7_9AGAR|nr:hypothetical protein EV360DRAFT_77436 [Lentinula raphanica]KAJ3774691.1 hypothetical protein FB446DRAFT_458282 [Lentinula raphanica]KAJ3816877.1 hypothetical protein F5880DRAFT_160867 [Lentinula raphanica]KAJ3833568.1 hypothetical protein F5878DRAFT_632531 [Lentinula raphanica]KAJ3970789.1 hypothetical protein EV361DRAFT_826413 [Lentinula raphanica]